MRQFQCRLVAIYDALIYHAMFLMSKHLFTGPTDSSTQTAQVFPTSEIMWFKVDNHCCTTTNIIEHIHYNSHSIIKLVFVIILVKELAQHGLPEMFWIKICQFGQHVVDKCMIAWHFNDFYTLECKYYQVADGSTSAMKLSLYLIIIVVTWLQFQHTMFVQQVWDCRWWYEFISGGVWTFHLQDNAVANQSVWWCSQIWFCDGHN